MELNAYLEILFRRKWIVFAVLVTTTAVALIGTFLVSPDYVTTAKVRVATVAGGSSDYVEYDLAYTERLMYTYAEIATSHPVLLQLQERLGLDYTPTVEVAPIPNTEILLITVTGKDPVLVMKVADLLVELLLEQSHRKDEPNRAALSIVEMATVPSDPIHRMLFFNAVIALMGGAMGGIALAFVVDNLSPYLETVEQIEAAIGPSMLLGRIPKTKRNRALTFAPHDSPQGEAFRRLRAMLLKLVQEKGLKTILITSAEPQTGKSTVVANLANVLTRSGCSVAIVDCDLRCPKQHELFHLCNQNGLNGALYNGTQPDKIIQVDDEHAVYVIPSGTDAMVPTKRSTAPQRTSQSTSQLTVHIQPHPTELLSSQKMVSLVQEMALRYDIVLLDTPALLPAADALALTPLTDLALLIVNPGRSRRDAVQVAYRSLQDAGVESIRLVVNRDIQLWQYAHYYGNQTRHRS